MPFTPNSMPYQQRPQMNIRPEVASDRMDKMLEELKAKIYHSSQTTEEPSRPQADVIDNTDYFLGKKFNLQESEAFFNSDSLVFSKRRSRKEERNTAPLRLPVEEVKREEPEQPQTPRPALNINLIDQTYQYKDIIDSMWDGGFQTPMLREPFGMTPLNPNDDKRIEFSLKDEF